MDSTPNEQPTQNPVPRTGATTRVTLARLNRVARRLLDQDIDRDQAVLEIRSITTEQGLLDQAAATSLARWRRDSISGWQGGDVAELLVEAGADREAVGRLSDEIR